MSDSARPHRRQPTRLPRPWDSPGKNTGVGCHFLLQCMKVKSESEVAQSCPTQRPLGLQPTRLLRPWDFPGKSTGVGASYNKLDITEKTLDHHRNCFWALLVHTRTSLVAQMVKHGPHKLSQGRYWWGHVSIPSKIPSTLSYNHCCFQDNGRKNCHQSLEGKC